MWSQKLHSQTISASSILKAVTAIVVLGPPALVTVIAFPATISVKSPAPPESSATQAKPAVAD